MAVNVCAYIPWLPFLIPIPLANTMFPALQRLNIHPIRLANVFRSPWVWLILGGYWLRLILMPITGQHDVMFMAWQSHFINQGHLNIYAYLYHQFGSVTLNRPGVWAPYPYSFYAVSSLWLEVLSRLHLVDLSNWPAIWSVPFPARYVFLFKLAYLPFDLVIGTLLYRSFGRKNGPAAWALWAWSPIALYTPFLMGQNDIYAVAFTVGAVYSCVRTLTEPHGLKRTVFAISTALLVGAGATFKIYPLILLPVLILIITPNWTQRLGLVLIGASLIVVASLPFLHTVAYQQGVLFNTEGMGLFRGISIFGVNLPPFLMAYSALLVYLAIPKSCPAKEVDPWAASLVTLALIFIFAPTQIYWLIWLLPFTIAIVFKRREWLWLWILLQFVFAVLLLNQHRDLGIGLPVHLSSEFALPNITVALDLRRPNLSENLFQFWTLLSTVFTIILATMAVAAIQLFSCSPQSAEIHFKPSHFIWIFLPVTAMAFGITVNLVLSRSLVIDQSLYGSFKELRLSAEKPVISQVVTPATNEVTGLHLRLFNSPDPALRLRACLRPSLLEGSETLGCVTASADQLDGESNLYVIFRKPIQLEAGQNYIATVELKDTTGALSLAYLDSYPDQLTWGGELIAGRLDISPMHAFRLQTAWRQLVVENILNDPDLPALMILAFLGTTLAIALLGQ
jgi:hypothetical protein